MTRFVLLRPNCDAPPLAVVDADHLPGAEAMGRVMFGGDVIAYHLCQMPQSAVVAYEREGMANGAQAATMRAMRKD